MRAALQREVTAALDASPDGWVVDGNYTSKVGAVVLPRADTVVCLHPPFPLAFWRLVKRTVSRAWTKESLWNTNRESWRLSFMSRDSILLWGITHWRAHFRNIDRASAARFSFLLSTPAIAGAAASALHHLTKQGGIPADMRTAFALGIAISAASGCAVIAFFLKYLQRNTLRFFIYYRLIFGIIVIALALFRRPAG